jgi:cell division septation protein DedD
MTAPFVEPRAEPAPPRDPELTLSSGTLLAIFFGLVVLCGLCFGLGYSVGHRGSQQPVAAAQPVDSAQPVVQVSAATPKPSANKQSAAAATTAPDAGDGQAGDPAADAQAAASLQNSQPSAGAGAPSGSSETTSTQVQPAQGTPAQVRPVVPAASTNPQPATGFASGARVQPALPSQAAFLVQIAAVSHPDDASVLVNALRKRGYTVTAQRKPEDGLIHVWIGPFGSRDEANRWKQKLLDDGYNAIVQP